MKAVIKGLMFSALRNTTTVEIEIEGNRAENIEPYKDKEIDFTPKAFHKKRGLNANAYFWVLLDRLATVTGYGKTEIYRNYVREIGGNNESVFVKARRRENLCRTWERNGLGWVTDIFPADYQGYRHVILYYGSSTYDAAQMSRLIDLAVQDCQALGIETKTPRQIADMISLRETERITK